MRYKSIRDIKGYENCKNDYLIYEDGRVFSCKSNRFLKPLKGSKGYLYIDIRKYSDRKSDCDAICPRIHRLVAMAFIPNPDNLPQVNHIDGNKENNHVDNLEWCTNLYNTIEAVRLGLKPKNEYHGKVYQYDLNGNFLNVFDTPKDAAKSISDKALGSNINRCIHGKRETAYGYIWKSK